MSSRIDTQELMRWCKIPADQLAGHPEAKVPLRVLPTPEEVHKWTAQEMLDEVKRNNAANRPTRWILPCGPTRQYAWFVSAVNQERISLANLHIFHMDDHLDWQGRHLPDDHRSSYKGWMLRNFYEPVDPELRIPANQRHFPSIYAIDAISRAIDAVGGVDTAYGGIGYRGHIAFNEPPRSPWYTVSPEEFRASTTRILHLADDTLIALSQRSAGGCSHAIPPMAITMGMSDLLAAGRIRLFSDTGAWKRTVIRYLLFGPVSTEYPVSFVQEHPDVLVVVDENTALPPLEE